MYFVCLSSTFSSAGSLSGFSAASHIFGFNTSLYKKKTPIVFNTHIHNIRFNKETKEKMGCNIFYT